jgi:hypothetical protein
MHFLKSASDLRATQQQQQPTLIASFFHSLCRNVLLPLKKTNPKKPPTPSTYALKWCE